MADCNTPAQLPCGPGPFVSPVCYTIPPALDVLNAFLSVTLNPDCSIATSAIVDSGGAPIVGAVQAPCPGACTFCGGTIIAPPLAFQNEGVPLGNFGCVDFVGAGVTASVGGCGITVTIPGGGAAVFPLLATNGSCAAPSYSFAASPSSGMWFDPALGPSGAVVISDNNCTNRINVGASVDIFSSTTVAVSLGGVLASAAGTNSFAIGAGASSAGANSISLGTGALAGFDRTVAIGNGAQTFGAEAIAIGDGAIAASGGGGTIPGVAIGNAAVAGGPEGGSIAIGDTANCTVGASVVIGRLANISTSIAAPINGSVVIGLQASATGNDNVSIGFLTTNIGQRGIAIGAGAAGITNSIALGESASALATESIAIGSDASTSGVSPAAIAIGDNASASASAAVAIGPNVTNAVADTLGIGSSNTNKITLSATGAAGLVGTSAQWVAPTYLVAALPAVPVAGGIIFVSDATPAPTQCFYDGTNWIDVLTGLPVV